MLTIERTTLHSQNATFQQEKETVAKDIAQGIEELITNLTMLNRNLELVNSLGKDFEQMNHLWSGFRQVCAGDDIQDEETETSEIDGTSQLSHESSP
ncbi:Dolichyl-diphosphooligosaccharide-protein glycosyltransferase subunit dad1 [Basidiobolus ranarum]|uniref:DASH complex subunit DAD1 n=1 Tax=Basidiobolus ranarum TaxID=34480 RepID=A0ABR2WF15_9FUNG